MRSKKVIIFYYVESVIIATDDFVCFINLENQYRISDDAYFCGWSHYVVFVAKTAVCKPDLTTLLQISRD